MIVLSDLEEVPVCPLRGMLAWLVDMSCAHLCRLDSRKSIPLNTTKKHKRMPLLRADSRRSSASWGGATFSTVEGFPCSDPSFAAIFRLG